MTGVSHWKLAGFGLGAGAATFLLWAGLWHHASGMTLINPVAGVGFGLALALGIGWIPFLAVMGMIAYQALAWRLDLDPRIGFFTIPLASLLLAIAVKGVTYRTGECPALVRRNQALWFIVGAFCFAAVWGTVETVLVEGWPRIFWSSTELERLMRRVFRDAAGLLTIGPFAAVFVGPWVRKWLGLSTQPGLSLSARDVRDTVIVVVLFAFGFWTGSKLESAWRIELYYLCLLPLLYFAAQRGIGVTIVSIFGCALTATTMWNQAGISTMQLGDLRALLVSYAMTALVIAGQAGERIHAFRVQGDLVRQLRRLTSHLESVREDEQTRIAREVHDELGGLLTALKLDLAMLRRQFSPAECQRLSGSVDTIIQTVQRIALELRPGVLDSLGLAAAVEWLGEDFQKRTGVRCVVKPLEDVSAGKEMAAAIYRILQEALTNVARHAAASEVRVSLVYAGPDIELRVEDNGRGISDEHLRASDSLGVTGMRERAAGLGGEVEIKRMSKGGTSVLARIPAGRVRAAGEGR